MPTHFTIPILRISALPICAFIQQLNDWNYATRFAPYYSKIYSYQCFRPLELI